MTYGRLWFLDMTYGHTSGIDIVTFVRTSYWNSMVYDIIIPAAMGLAFLIHDLLPVVVTRVTDTHSGAGTAYISGASDFTPGLYGRRVARS